MYHQEPSSLLGPGGHTGWYIVADLPTPRSRREHRKRPVGGHDPDRIARLMRDEWETVEGLLDPSRRVESEILRPGYHVGDWWTGFLMDVAAMVENRRGKRSAIRKVLVVHLDSPAWDLVFERKGLPNAPVTDRWSGVTKRSFDQETAVVAAQHAGQIEQWSHRYQTREMLKRAADYADGVADRARDRIIEMDEEESRWAESSQR